MSVTAKYVCRSQGSDWTVWVYNSLLQNKDSGGGKDTLRELPLTFFELLWQPREGGQKTGSVDRQT